jgi:hypothetical protein
LGSSSDEYGAYEYSSESDIFAIAASLTDFLLGKHSAFFPADKYESEAKRIKRLLFLVRILYDTGLQNEVGLKFESTQAKNTMNHLREIQSSFPIIYRHFEDVFVGDRRDYITASLPVSDFRHLDYWDYQTEI